MSAPEQPAPADEAPAEPAAAEATAEAQAASPAQADSAKGMRTPDVPNFDTDLFRLPDVPTVTAVDPEEADLLGGSAAVLAAAGGGSPTSPQAAVAPASPQAAPAATGSGSPTSPQAAAAPASPQVAQPAADAATAEAAEAAPVENQIGPSDTGFKETFTIVEVPKKQAEAEATEQKLLDEAPAEAAVEPEEETPNAKRMAAKLLQEAAVPMAELKEAAADPTSPGGSPEAAAAAAAPASPAAAPPKTMDAPPMTMDPAESKRVLIVATSASKLGEKADTGVWSEECSGPYYYFLDRGCTVTVCSLAGGDVPIDASSLTEDYKTNNDARMEAEEWAPLKGTPKLADQDIEGYDILFFSGGHGTCVDFPTDDVGAVVSGAMQAGKVVAAVCHGPNALVRALAADGPAVRNRKVTCFSDAEEEAVGQTGNVPFLLESKLRELGAHVEVGPQFADHAVRDGLLVTGQNPQSSMSCARLALEASQSAADGKSAEVVEQECSKAAEAAPVEYRIGPFDGTSFTIVEVPKKQAPPAMVRECPPCYWAGLHSLFPETVCRKPEKPMLQLQEKEKEKEKEVPEVPAAVAEQAAEPKLADTAVTIVPFYKLKDAGMFKDIWKADYEVRRPDCLHFAHCFSEDGERALSCEAFSDAEKVLQQCTVATPFSTEFSQAAELERLEAHGPAEELEKLREKLGPLGCSFYATELGFRAPKPALPQDTVCHLSSSFSLKQPEEFRKLAYAAYQEAVAQAEPEGSVQYAVSFDEAAGVASLRQAYDCAEGLLARMQAMTQTFEAVTAGPAELLRMELHGPPSELERLRPGLEQMGCAFYELERGFRSEVAAEPEESLLMVPPSPAAACPAAAEPEEPRPVREEAPAAAAAPAPEEAAAPQAPEPAPPALEEVASPQAAAAEAEAPPPAPPLPLEEDGVMPPLAPRGRKTPQREAPPPPPPTMGVMGGSLAPPTSPGSRFARDHEVRRRGDSDRQKDEPHPAVAPRPAGTADPVRRGISLTEIDSEMANRLERFFSDDKLSHQVQQVISSTKTFATNLRTTGHSQVASRGPELFRVEVPRPYPGVQYRKSKDLNERHNKFAANGETVEGIVEDDGEWLRISADVYVPMRVGSVQILQPLQVAAEAAPQHAEAAVVTDSATGGPPQCWSCNMQ